MAKNNKHWKNMMASSADQAASKEGIDPLEVGLEELSWFENQKRIAKKNWNKTRETFGEEVGNSISSGVLAIYLLFLIPFAAVTAYRNGFGTVNPGEVTVIWTPIINYLSVSAFVITAFLASLFTTIYHCMKHGTPQKRIFHKLDRIMTYFAIFGVYAPMCLSLVKGTLGIVVLAIEFALAIFGMFFIIFGYPNNKGMTKVAIADYIVMGLLGLIFIKPLFAAASAACFWLIIAGAIVYAIGIFFYSGKNFKFSHMVWHILVVFATVCHVLAFVYFL